MRASKKERLMEDLVEGLYQPYDFNLHKVGIFVWIIIAVLVVLGVVTLLIARLI